MVWVRERLHVASLGFEWVCVGGLFLAVCAGELA